MLFLSGTLAFTWRSLRLKRSTDNIRMPAAQFRVYAKLRCALLMGLLTPSLCGVFPYKGSLQRALAEWTSNTTSIQKRFGPISGSVGSNVTDMQGLFQSLFQRPLPVRTPRLHQPGCPHLSRHDFSTPRSPSTHPHRTPSCRRCHRAHHPPVPRTAPTRHPVPALTPPLPMRAQVGLVPSPSLVCGAGTALNQTTHACEVAAYGPGTFFNAATNACEISCSSDSGRRLAEADSCSSVCTAARAAASDPDKLSSRELVAGYLAHNSELAARLDDEHVEQLVQLFGPPALV